MNSGNLFNLNNYMEMINEMNQDQIKVKNVLI